MTSRPLPLSRPDGTYSMKQVADAIVADQRAKRRSKSCVSNIWAKLRIDAGQRGERLTPTQRAKLLNRARSGNPKAVKQLWEMYQHCRVWTREEVASLNQKISTQENFT